MSDVIPDGEIARAASWLAGARVVIVNASPTPYDAIAGAVLRQPIAAALPRLVDTAH